MHTVVVRKMPAAHYQKLRKQAAANGRSMEAELRALVAVAYGDNAPTKVEAASSAKPKTGKKRMAAPLLTAKERQALKPDAQAALQRLREMFADRKGEPKASVDEFLKGRRQMWGEE